MVILIGHELGHALRYLDNIFGSDPLLEVDKTALSENGSLWPPMWVPQNMKEEASERTTYDNKSLFHQVRRRRSMGIAVLR